MSRILITLTSHATLGDTGRATGFHWEELATPYWAFRDAGHTVEIASIAGGRAVHDPGSAQTEAPSVARFLADATAMAALAETMPITAADPAGYTAIYLPGGHGTMWDLPGNTALAGLLGAVFDRGGVVAAVCHGPAGLLSAVRADGQPIVAGRRVNSFTDAEEAAIKLTEAMPFPLETRLRELGAVFEGGANFKPYAVRDGNLVTGQNPASAAEVARLVLQALAEAPALAA